jgi:DNA-binding GntR family transcriptional regulator
LAAHKEHMQLLEAMEQRDIEAAVRIVRGHIQAGKQNVLADLKQRQEIRELRIPESSN